MEELNPMNPFGPTDPPPNPPTPFPPKADPPKVATKTKEALAVEAADKTLADAKKVHDKAQSDYDKAVADHEKAIEAAAEKPVNGKHVFLEGAGGKHTLVAAPDGYNAERPDHTITLGGKDLHHVADQGVTTTGPDGKPTTNTFWVYRPK